MGNNASAVTPPYQLTQWPHGALPGQLPLFNPKAEVGLLLLSALQAVVRHFTWHLCFHCEILIIEHFVNHLDHSKRFPAAAEAIWRHRNRFEIRPRYTLFSPLSLASERPLPESGTHIFDGP